MYSTLFSVALFAATTLTGTLAGFAISTPQFTQCQEATFSWEKTVGPYHVIVVKTDNPCGDPVLDLGEIDKTSISWPVQLPAGANVQLYVEDSSDNDAWSGPIVVGKSDDASCVSKDVFKMFGLEPPASSSVHSTSASPTVHGTTLVVPAPSSTTTAVVNEPENSGIVPVGAANAGSNPFGNAAPATRQIDSLTVTICASIAIFFLML